MMLTTNNSKLVKAGKKHGAMVASFTLPAGPTCPYAGFCAIGCYAKCGTFTWPAPKAKHQSNFEESKKAEFFRLMLNELDYFDATATRRGKQTTGKKLPTFVRIHDAGDFYSQEYLNKWVALAHTHPDTTFYAYSKSLPFIRAAAGSIPSNMTFVFSSGGKLDSTINTETERHTKVFSTEAELVAAGYVNASADDLVAADPSVIKVGLVFHGSKAQAKAWGVEWVGKK